MLMQRAQTGRFAVMQAACCAFAILGGVSGCQVLNDSVAYSPRLTPADARADGTAIREVSAAPLQRPVEREPTSLRTGSTFRPQNPVLAPAPAPIPEADDGSTTISAAARHARQTETSGSMPDWPGRAATTAPAAGDVGYAGRGPLIRPAGPQARLQSPELMLGEQPPTNSAALPVVSPGPPFGGHSVASTGSPTPWNRPGPSARNAASNQVTRTDRPDTSAWLISHSANDSSQADSSVTAPVGAVAGPNQPPSQNQTSAAEATPPLEVSAIRDLLNQRSANSMSQGTILADKPAVMQTNIRTESGQTPAQVPETSAGGSAAVIPAQPNLPGAPLPQATADSESDGTVTDAASEQGGGQPTMLERLRELYDPIEANSRQLFRRPFQRLPTPWNMLRDRDPAAEPNAQTADASLADPATEAAGSAGTDSSDLLLQLIQHSEQRLQNWPRLADGSPEQPQRFRQTELDLRLLYLIADRPGAAIEALGSLPPGEQDFWQELVLGLSQYRSRDGELTQQQHLADVVAQIKTAVQRAEPLSALVIRRLDFCSRIDGFGQIEEFPSADFDPGQPVLIYAEMANVGSELQSNGLYSTRFAASLQVFRDGDTEPIETITLNDIEDQSGTRRSDYYQSFELTIPAHLWAARYEIRLNLRDLVTNREATEVLEFQVR